MPKASSSYAIDFGPPLKSPFRGAIDRVCRLTSKPAWLETMTMRPDFCARKVGSSARVNSSTPKKFVSITRRISDCGMSSSAPATATPALCTTASIASVCARMDATAPWIEFCIAHVELTDRNSVPEARILQGALQRVLSREVTIVANTRHPRAAKTSVVTCRCLSTLP